jgi:UDP-glucose 4-epimerase
MKSALVTGIAGFIGSSVAKKLIKDGYTVYGIDNLLTGYAKNVPAEAEFVEGSVAVKEDIARLPKKVDAVFHLAAQSSGEISFENPLYDIEANVAGTYNMLSYAKEAGAKKFVFSSSMSVYGECGTKLVKESYCPVPNSYYGITKLAGEGYARLFSNEFSTSVFRLFSVYGPGQNMENMKQGMVSIFLSYFLKNEPVVVKGSLDRVRDFVYIDDVVDILTASLDRSQPFEICNLGYGRAVSVGELLEAMKKAFGDEGREIIVDGSTSGDIMGMGADISTLQNLYGKSPKVGIEEGLAMFARWAKGGVC